MCLFTHIFICIDFVYLVSSVVTASFDRSYLTFMVHDWLLVVTATFLMFCTLTVFCCVLFLLFFYLLQTKQMRYCCVCYLLYSVHSTLELDKQIEIKRFETTHKKCVHAHSIQIMSKQFKLFHFLLNNNAAHILFTRIACVTYWVKTKMKSTEKKWQTKRNIYAA